MYGSSVQEKMNKSILIFLLFFIGICFAVTVPPWNIELAQQQGPNVCVVEEVPGTKYRLWTECKYWSPRLICGQKPILRYDCCGGYMRVPRESGCTQVNQLDNILETAKNLGAKKFVTYIEESGAVSSFTSRGPITLFAPSDEAFQELSVDRLRKLERWRGSGLHPTLLYHSVPGRLYSHQFKGDLLVDTRQPNSKLRINKFSSKIDTVNCARILRKDEEATNGVVHIIDTLLEPESWQSEDIAETISRDGRFNQIARALDITGVSNQLRTSGQPVTIFAPSDEAFDSLSKDHLYRLTNDRTALTELVKSHILPHPLCLPALTKDLKLRSINEDTKLEVTCETGRYRLGKNHLSQRFIMTPNGIILPIDHIILPDQAKSPDQLLDKNGTKIFRHIFRLSDLERTLRDSRPYTIFAPSDEAMSRLPQTYIQVLRTNRGEARRFASSHIMKRKFQTEDIVDNERQRTMDDSQILVFQVLRKSFGVNGALIEEADIKGLDCVLHIINKVITPPTRSIQQILQANSTYSIFLEALERARRYDSQLIQDTPTKTILIPTNQAFYKLGAYKLDSLRNDRDYLNKVVRNHIIEGVLSSETFQPSLYYNIQSNGKELKINRNGDYIEVNGGIMIDCDISTTNGIVHTIDKVIVPDD